MERKVTFDKQTGDVLVAGPVGTDRIMYGVVLLTPEQAKESLRHGWREFKGTTHNEREMGLVRMQKSSVAMQVVPTVTIDHVCLSPEQVTLLRAVVQTVIAGLEQTPDLYTSTSASQLRGINTLLSGGR